VDRMTKRGRLPLSATEARIAHTKQKPKPRFVTRAHVQEQADDPLAFDDVRKVLARAESAKKLRKS